MARRTHDVSAEALERILLHSNERCAPPHPASPSECLGFWGAITT